VTGDARTLGKTPGKDARVGKPTLVAVLGVEPARAEVRRLGDLARQAALALPSGGRGLPRAFVERVLSRER
jgi:farnesyl diphosphate synthase